MLVALTNREETTMTPIYEVKYEMWQGKRLAHARKIEAPDKTWTQTPTFNADRWITQGKAVEVK